MPIVRVALDVPLATLFDYTTEEQIVPGQRIVVPFGRRQLVGIAMECAADTDIPFERIKTAIRVLPDTAPISGPLLTLLKFCSDYYHYPIGQTVHSALPSAFRTEKIAPQPVAEHYRLSDGSPDADTLPKRKVVARQILAQLAVQPCSKSQIKAAAPQLKWLEAAGFIERFIPAQAVESKLKPQHIFVNAHLLTEQQQHVIDSIIDSKGYNCFLLHGITGSGKTEIYAHLMHLILQHGGQILLLVPEINLTPQLEGYFLKRFPDTSLVSLHSGLSEKQKLKNWQEAQSGQAQIVLGTRLSVFSELPKLALIIVDEEHDSSFKQQDGLRYSARDVAVFRANQCKIPIVLGSATPSLESYHNAQTGRYSLLKLTARAQSNAKLPSVKCIHTQQSVMTDGISDILLREIGIRLARKEQTLLFINRRGYAPVMMCTECGWMSDCKYCAGKMVLHLKENRLRCHHCGDQIKTPTACPKCGHSELLPVGSGTQRIESLLQIRFPDARILRVDRDSTRNKHAWQKMRQQIHANEVDILIGTQMLAKGHDFPSLTLVGVLNPDSALYSSDFRAAEKLFAQLMQVAGRAGRADKPGEVLIQTAFPDHPLFICLQHHDFDDWAAQQLRERQMASFPPYTFQAVLRTEGMDEAAVYAYLHKAKHAAIELKHPVEILGVVPAALARRASHVRAQLLIQSSARKSLQKFLRDWQKKLDDIPARGLRCSIDIDPLEF